MVAGATQAFSRAHQSVFVADATLAGCTLSCHTAFITSGN